MMIKSLYPLSKINEITINSYINTFADLGYISVCGKRNKTFIFRKDTIKRILGENKN
jgi:predicted site-specific integrase-resolvase